jgi:chromate reductase
MSKKKNILIINGSASKNSSNQKLIAIISDRTTSFFNVSIINDLKILPHFNPDLSRDKPPEEIIDFRVKIEKADGIIICTPEYVFSIPSGLKNAIEWCVSTTVFSDKPIGLITASAAGERSHEELQLIMKTVMTKFTEKTTLLIQGIKSKINEQGELTDNKTIKDIENFIGEFKNLVYEN